MITRNDGYILITSLLLMLVLTIVGMAAINTSTIDNTLSGNVRIRERNLAKAEAGIDIAIRATDHVKRTGNTTGYSSIIIDAALENELSINYFDPDTATGSPDLQFTVDTGPVMVDIDKMDILAWVPGSSIEFASGYEGPGKGAATSAPTYMRINAVGQGTLQSEAEAGLIFRYVPQNK